MALAEYKRLLTQAYDLDKPAAPPEALAFYRRFIEASATPTLAAMCGSGRYLVPMLEAGIDADGVDASADMLAACRRRCDERGLRANLYEQRLHEMRLPRSYGSTFIGGASFGLIVDGDEAAEVLRRLHDHLAPDGHLILEVERPPTRGYSGLMPERSWVRPDGGRIVLTGEVAYDAEERAERGVGVYELRVDGEVVETETNLWLRRYWEPEAMVDLLEATGFVEVAATKAMDGGPLDGTEGLVGLVATRPG